MSRTVLFLALVLAGAAAHADTPFEEIRPLQPDARVSLDNVKGRIEVDTWDRSEIRIAGERGKGTTGLRISGDASRLQVKIEYPENSGWFGRAGDRAAPSRLQVTLPAGVRLEAESVSADIEIRGLAGPALEVGTVSGGLVVETTAREVELESVSGDVRLTARSTDVSVESVSGAIRIEGDISGRLSLEAVSGDIHVATAAPLRQVEAGVVSGDIALQLALQPGGRLSAESLSGDLELVLAPGTSARLQATSFSGRIRSDVGEVEKPEYGPGSSLRTTLGNGDGRITLETFSGDLTVRSR